MDDEAFGLFLADTTPRLAKAFSAAYGIERGEDALAEALAYAWEHRAKLGEMANPAGYLYRVGQSRSRHLFRRQQALLPAPRTLR